MVVVTFKSNADATKTAQDQLAKNTGSTIAVNSSPLSIDEMQNAASTDADSIATMDSGYYYILSSNNTIIYSGLFSKYYWTSYIPFAVIVLLYIILLVMFVFM